MNVKITVWILVILMACVVCNCGDYFHMHASCKMRILVSNTSCTDVYNELSSQVSQRRGFDKYCIWSDTKNKNEFCGYSVQPNDTPALQLLLKHETPINHYIDDIYIRFYEENSVNNTVDCGVVGQSKSESISYYDYDTNYCNIFNLFRNGNSSEMNFKLSINIEECEFHPDIRNQSITASVKQCNKY